MRPPIDFASVQVTLSGNSLLIAIPSEKRIEKRIKMKILEPIHKRFTLLSICPSNLNEPFIKFRNIVLSVTCFILNTLISPACFTFISRNLNDLESVLYALIAGLNTTVLGYVMIAAFILRHQITDIFSAFQDIHDKCKYLFQILQLLLIFFFKFEFGSNSIN